MRQIDYWFMYHDQVGNQINLSSLIFQDLIKVVRGNIKTIMYCMHLSYIIRGAGCNVEVDLPLQQSKYTSFDKHTFRHRQYIMDAHDNYVKKPGKVPKQPELEEAQAPNPPV